MATMKIGEEDESYSTANFSFPNNPNTADIPLTPNRKFTTIPFGKMHIVSDFGGTNPKLIVLTGTFKGSTKRTDYNNLAKHVNQDKLKKFFITDTKFYYVLGSNIKETLSGTKTNFIDYVATFWTPIPYAMSDTEETYNAIITDANETALNDATTDSTGSFSNLGNAPAFVGWAIGNIAGNTITKVEVGDGSTIAGSDRTITWEGTLAKTHTLDINIIKFVKETGGHKYMKYVYTTIGDTQSGSRSIGGETTGMTYVDTGTTDQKFSVKLTGNTGTANVVGKYRVSNLS